jgi:hypothetical protein
MVGCDDKIGGYCNGFHKYTAKVINNDCHLTSGYVHHGRSSDDDGVGFNCNVHIKYINKDGYNITCPIYRSDSDDCSPLVTTWKQKKRCTKLNNKDYPLGKEFTIYVNNVDGRCETHHLIQKYAIIGFVFLVTSGLLIIISIFIYICERLPLKKDYTIPNSIELPNKNIQNV